MNYSVIEVVLRKNIHYTPEHIMFSIRDYKDNFNIQYSKISLLNLNREMQLIIKFDDIILNEQYYLFMDLLNDLFINIVIKSKFYFITTIHV